MNTISSIIKRLKLNQPSLRKNSRPPKQRTGPGQAFTAANLGVALSLQHCENCGKVQYPPRELCQNCLNDALIWKTTDTTGTLLAGVDLHHSLWEFYKRHIKHEPWPIASVQLSCDAIVFTHIYLASFTVAAAGVIAADTEVAVFSHNDIALQSVLIAVAAGTAVSTSQQRTAIARRLGLLETAIKTEGI